MRIRIFFLVALSVNQAHLHAQTPTITNQPANMTIWAGSRVMLAVGVSGAGPFSYQWQLNRTNLPNGIITTIAGNGDLGNSGDGGSATNATLDYPEGVAVDRDGNVFVGQLGGNGWGDRVRMIDTHGIITTIAGNGTDGYSGDWGLATNASLSEPLAVAVDGAGNVFIVDSDNGRVREVSNGIIVPFAGNGDWRYPGDGSLAVNAGVAHPYGVAVDGWDNVFIADDNTSCVRKVNASGIISTVAGLGWNCFSGDGGLAINAGLFWPRGMAVDGDDNLFIADYANQRIRKVTPAGIITTIAGNGVYGYSGDGGPATNAELWNPSGVAVDRYNNLFIADSSNGRVRKVVPDGTITTVAGGGIADASADGGPATNAILRSPSGVAVDEAGVLLIADSYNQRIRKVIFQGPVLALNNVSEANAGDYQVVVTGPGGSVTSSVAKVTITTSPLIYATVPNPNGSVTFSFVNQPGTTNVVFCATNVVPPVLWHPVSTNAADGGGNWQYIDTNAVTTGARFFRFQQQ